MESLTLGSVFLFVCFFVFFLRVPELSSTVCVMCWCCCSNVVSSGVILIPKSPTPTPLRPPKPLSIWNPLHYPPPTCPLPPIPNLKRQCKLIQGVCGNWRDVERNSKNTEPFLSLTVHVWMSWLRCVCVCFTEMTEGKKVFFEFHVSKKARHFEGKTSCFCCSSVIVR